VLTLLALAGSLAAAGDAHAGTFFLEAEGPTISTSGTYSITSPLLIKDDSTASSGRYITVETGLNSKTTPPAAEGVAILGVFLGENDGGTYRIWGRVKAPNDGDDSFWIRVDGGTAIRWNEIELGSSWHWDTVKPEGSSSPSTFSLGAGFHTIEVGYREDGTKLDVVVLTSDLSFNPDSPPTTVPPSGAPGTALAITSTAGAQTGIMVMWNAVPGAASYTVRRFDGSGMAVWQTGITNFKVVDTGPVGPSGNNCYDVLAIFPDNSFAQPIDFTCAAPVVDYSFNPVGGMSITSPMVFGGANANEISTVPGTTESLSSVPAHGRARVDFMTGGASQVRLWFRPVGPNPDADSFWVRMDDGAWFRWNNFTLGCQPVGDFTNNPVTFSVGAGTHRFEIAYREIGAKLQTDFFITDDLQATASICSD
jgi:hypothetical protein